MSTVTTHAAKTNLSKLLARVEAGEEIVIARGKTPIARLTPIRPPAPARHFGAMKGIVSVGPEFFEPMTDAELRNGNSSTGRCGAGGKAATGFTHPPPFYGGGWRGATPRKLDSTALQSPLGRG
jgi:prevent-host-death family protein